MQYTLPADLDIEDYARRYTARQSEEERAIEERIERLISPATKRDGWYRRDEFLELCRWKSRRTQSRCAQNAEPFIHEVTAAALTTPNERFRIEVLTLLDGVDWPTASVLLHFGHRDPYPILDVRALWSLNIPRPSAYHFAFWTEYVRICRQLAEKYDVSMRTLDRALWEFSKQRQPKLPRS